jgi:bacteriorhodopsin
MLGITMFLWSIYFTCVSFSTVSTNCVQVFVHTHIAWVVDFVMETSLEDFINL